MAGLADSHMCAQSPQHASDKAIWASAKLLMENSAQKLNLTDVSTARDMSMLLAQSAVQVRPATASHCLLPHSLTSFRMKDVSSEGSSGKHT